MSFSSEIMGLYLDTVKDRGSYFELAVLPGLFLKPLHLSTGKYRRSRRFQKMKKGEKAFMMNGSKDLPIPFLRRDIWEKYHLAVGIPLDLRVHPHSFLLGSTGAGKTTAIKLFCRTYLICHGI